jgi:4-alpha-glucanotransferase
MKINEVEAAVGVTKKNIRFYEEEGLITPSREPGNYLPYTYPRNSVVYTGTHDNVTTEGWRQSASAEDVAYACRYLRCAPEDLTESMICACLSCVSDMAVIPLADWLHLDAEARINTPSTQGANWQWRLPAAHPGPQRSHR